MATGVRPATGNTKRRGEPTKTRYSRWISIGAKNPFRRTLLQARRLGIELIDGWKPGMCAWYALRFSARAEQMRALQAWWREQGIDWYQRRPNGAWEPRDYPEPVSYATALRNSK